MDEDTAFPLWQPGMAVPALDEIPFAEGLQHHAVEQAVEGEYHYLHEPAMAFRGGVLYACWANGPRGETNTHSELIRGRRSTDEGRRWGPIEIVAPGGPALAHNHPVMLSHPSGLWVFAARWEDQARLFMEAFRMDEKADRWVSAGKLAKDFVPFDRPKRMADGNWILGGEHGFYGGPKVLISNGDDLTRWRPVQIPLAEPWPLAYPETTVLLDEPRLTAIMRFDSKDKKTNPMPNVALVSTSEDFGRSWTPAVPSNLPMQPSKPFADTLSTGQNYLVCNYPNGRDTLVVAITAIGERHFRRLWKIRDGKSPRRFLKISSWCYPCAVEHDGLLWIIYTVSKENCELATVPVASLCA